MEQLTAKLKGQFAESSKLEKVILKNLASLGFADDWGWGDFRNRGSESEITSLAPGVVPLSAAAEI